MSANSLKIAETTKVQAAATVVAKDETPKTTKFQGNELIPALWTIAPTEDGIIATNSTTGSKFEGTIAEFNAKLRG